MINNDMDRHQQNLYTINDELDDEPLYSLDDEGDEPAVRRNAYMDGPADDEEEDDDEYEDDIEAEEDVQAADTETVRSAKTPSPVGIMFKTLLTPVEGWKALKRARFSTDDFAARCFYPIIGLAALARGAALFYEANKSVADWAVDGVITFMAYFFGYFTVMLAGPMLLPRKTRDLLKKEIGRQLVMLAMSTVAMFGMSLSLLPMLDPVLVFLPIWTIYIIFKGVRVVRVPKDTESSTTAMMCMLIIGAPLLWNWLLEEMMRFVV